MGLVVGLLGGVGSGKSTVARLMAARGFALVDADAEARAAVELPAVRERLAKRFGSDLFDAAGALDRERLARRAFADEAGTQALNEIVHPEVRRRIEAALTAAEERPVVLDVPLLVESPLSGSVDVWVFIDAPTEQRDARVARRGWDPDERSRREARQADLAAKRRRADHVLENRGSIEDLEPQVDALLAKLGVPVLPERRRRET